MGDLLTQLTLGRRQASLRLGGILGTVAYTPPVSPLPFTLVDLYDGGGTYVTSTHIDVSAWSGSVGVVP